MNSWRNVSSLAFLITLLLTAPTPAPGAVVQSCDEAGLRAALAAGGPAKFGCDGTIVLTNPIVVTTDLTLEADGHDVRLSGDGKVRLFEVSANGSSVARMARRREKAGAVRFPWTKANCTPPTAGSKPTAPLGATGNKRLFSQRVGRRAAEQFSPPKACSGSRI